jgi:hypothetical protein
MLGSLQPEPLLVAQRGHARCPGEPAGQGALADAARAGDLRERLSATWSAQRAALGIEEGLFDRVRGQGAGGGVGRRGFGGAAEAAEQVGA